MRSMRSKLTGKTPHKIRFEVTLHRVYNVLPGTTSLRLYLKRANKTYNTNLLQVERGEAQSNELIPLSTTLYRDNKSGEYDTKVVSFTLKAVSSSGKESTYAAVAIDVSNFVPSSASELPSEFKVPLQQGSKVLPTHLHVSICGYWVDADDSVSVTDSEAGNGAVALANKQSFNRPAPRPIGRELAAPVQHGAATAGFDQNGGALGIIVGQKCALNVRASDVFGNIMQRGGDTVEVRITGPPRSKTPVATVMDHRDGTYGVEFVPDKPGRYVLGVVINGRVMDASFELDAIQGSQPVMSSQVVLRGEASKLTEAVTGSTSELLIQCADYDYGELMTGKEALSVRVVTPSGVNIAAPLAFDGGLYQAMLYWPETGPHKVVVMIDGDAVPGSPFMVQSGAQEVCLPVSQMYGAGLTHAIAGQKATFIIEARDARGNRLHTGQAMFRLMVQTDQQSVEGVVLDRGDGAYEASYVLTDASPFTLTISLSTSSISFEGVCDAGLTHVPQCFTIPSEAISIFAGQTTNLRVLRHDSFGNQVNATQDMLRFHAQASGPGPAQVHTVDLGDGSCEVRFEAEVAGQYLLHVIGGESKELLPGSPFFVNVLSVMPSSETSTVSIVGGVVVGGSDESPDVIEAIAGKELSIEVDALDKFGNSTEWSKGDPASVVVMAEGQSETVRFEGVALEEMMLRCSSTLTIAGSFLLHLEMPQGTPVHGWPRLLQVVPGACAPENSLVTPPVPRHPECGRVFTVTVRTRDRYRNQLSHGGDMVDGLLEGPHGASARAIKVVVNAFVGEEAQFDLDMKYSAIRVADCELDGELVQNPTVKVNQMGSVVLKPKGWNEGQRMAGNEAVTMRLMSPTGSMSNIDPKFDEANGRYFARTIFLEPGTFTLTCRVDMACDAYGNVVSQGGDRVELFLTGPDNQRQQAVAKVTDHGDGTYSAAFVLVQPGDWEVTVIVNDVVSKALAATVPAERAGMTAADAQLLGTSPPMLLTTATFVVKLKDKQTHQFSGREKVVFSVHTPSQSGFSTLMKYNAPQQLWVASVPWMETGRHRISAAINGAHVTSSPMDVKVTDDPAEAKRWAISMGWPEVGSLELGSIDLDTPSIGGFNMSMSMGMPNMGMPGIDIGGFDIGTLDLMPFGELEITFSTMTPEVQAKLVQEMLKKDPKKAAKLMEGLSPEDSASTLKSMPESQAGLVVMEMNPVSAAMALKRMDPEQAAGILNNCTPDKAAGTVFAMLAESPAAAAELLHFLLDKNPYQAKEILRRLDTPSVVSLLQDSEPEVAVQILSSLSPSQVTDMMANLLRQPDGSSTIADMLAAARQMPEGEEKRRLIEQLAESFAAASQSMSPKELAKILENMCAEDCALMLSRMDPAQAAAVLALLPPMLATDTSNLLNQMERSGGMLMGMLGSGRGAAALSMPMVSLKNSIISGEGLTKCVAGTPAKFTIESMDIRGDRISKGGANFEVQISAPGVDVFGDVEDLMNGKYKVRYVVEKAGHFDLSVNLRTLDGNKMPGQTFMPECLPGEPDMVFSCVDKLESLEEWNAGEWLSMNLRQSDRFGNMISTKAVDGLTEATGQGPGQVVVDVEPQDDGTIDVHFQTTVAGKYVLDIFQRKRGYFGGESKQSYKGMPMEISCNAGLVDATGCQLKVMESAPGSSPGMVLVTAGVEVLAEMKAQDEFQNRSRWTEDVEVRVTAAAMKEVPFTAGPRSRASQEYRAVIKESGTYRLLATINGMAIGHGPRLLQVQPGPLDPRMCIVRGAALTELTCGAPSQLMLLTADQYGNPCQGNGDTVEVRLEGPGGRVANALVVDCQDGTHLAKFTVQYPGAWILRTLFNGREGANCCPTLEEDVKDTPMLIECTDNGSGPSAQEYKMYLLQAKAAAMKPDSEYRGVPSFPGDTGQKLPDDDDEEIEIDGKRWRVGDLKALRIGVNQKYKMEMLMRMPGFGSLDTSGMPGMPDMPGFGLDGFDLPQMPGKLTPPFEVEVDGPSKLEVEVLEQGDGCCDIRVTGSIAGRYSCKVFGEPPTKKSTFGFGGRKQRIEVSGSPVEIDVLPGPLAPARCMAWMPGGDGDEDGPSDPNTDVWPTIVAQAGQELEVMVMPCDQHGNTTVWTGQSVFVEATGTLDCTFDAERERELYSAVISKSGTYTLHASVDRVACKGWPRILQLTAGPAHAGSCTLQGDPLHGMLCGATGVLTVQKLMLRSADAHGNYRAQGGDLVEAQLTGPNGAREQASVSDLVDGTYSIQFVLKQAGRWVLLVSVNGAPVKLTGYEFTASFGPLTSTDVELVVSAATPANSSAGNASRRRNDEMVCGTSSTVTIALTDKARKLTGKEGLSMRITSPTGVSTMASLTLEEGQTRCSARALWSEVGVFEVVATLDGEHIRFSPFQVVVEPQDIHLPLCQISGPEDMVFPAGVLSTVTLLPYDSRGNKVMVQGAKIQMNLLLDENPFGGAVYLTEDGYGGYMGQVVLEQANLYTLVLTLAGQGDMTGAQVRKVEMKCVPGETDLGRCIASVGDQLRVMAGQSTTFSVTRNDKYGNRLTNTGGGMPGVPGMTDMGLGSFSMGMSMKGKPKGREKKPKEAVNMTPAQASQQLQKKQPKEDTTPVLAKCVLEGSGTGLCTAGKKGFFTIVAHTVEGVKIRKGGAKFAAFVQVKDGETVRASVADKDTGSYIVSYVVETAGEHELVVRHTGATDTPEEIKRDFTCMPAECSAKNCDVDVRELVSWTAGLRACVRIVRKDKFDNLIPVRKGEARFTGKGTGPGSVDVTSDENADGSCNVHLTGTVTGQYKIQIFSSKKKEEVKGSPFNAVLLAGEPNPRKCQVSVESARGNSGVAVFTAGNELQASLIAHDKYGNVAEWGENEQASLVATGPTTVNLTVSGRAGRALNFKEIFPTAGGYMLQAKVNNKDVLAGDKVLLVQPAAVDPTRCLLNIGEVPEGGIVCHKPHPASVQTVDRYGNLCVEGGAQIDVILKSPDQGDLHATNLVDAGDGSYNLDIVLTRAGRWLGQLMVNKRLSLKGSQELLGVWGRLHANETHLVGGNSETGIATCGSAVPLYVEAIEFQEVGRRMIGREALVARVFTPSGVNEPLVLHFSESVGRYDTKLLWAQAGPHTISVQLDGHHINGSPYKVNVSSKDMWLPACKLAPSGAIKATAGVMNTLQFETCDAHGNRMASGGAPLNFSIRIVRPTSYPSLLPARWPPFSLYHLFEQGPFLLRPRQRFAGVLSAVGPVYRADPARIMVMMLPYAGADVMRATARDNDDGTYQVSFTISKAGPFQLHVALNSQERVDYGANYGQLSAKEVVFFGGAAGEKVACGTEAMLSVQAQTHESAGRLMAGTELITVTLCSPSSVKYSVVLRLEDGSARFKAPLRFTEVGKNYVEVLLDGQHLEGSPYQVSVVPDGKIYLSNCILKVESEADAVGGAGGLRVAGEVGVLRVMRYDMFGNHVPARDGLVAFTADCPRPLTVQPVELGDGSVELRCRPQRTGVYQVTVSAITPSGGTQKKDGVPGSPVDVMVAAGPVSPYFCTAAFTEGVMETSNLLCAIAGEELKLMVQARDAYSNNTLWDMDLMVSAEAEGPRTLPMTRLSASGEVYNFIGRIVTAGSYLMRVTVGRTHIAGWPRMLQGSGLEKTVAGEKARFIIEGRDKFGNKLFSGGRPIVLNAILSDGSQPQSHIVTDNMDGTYSASYVVTQAGPYKLELSSSRDSGKRIWEGQCLPGGTYVPSCTLDDEDLRLRWVAGKPSRVRVIRRDVYGNKVMPANDKELLQFSAQASGPGPVVTEVVELGRDGDLEVRMTGRVVGMYSVVVSSGSQQVRGCPLTIPLSAGRATSSSCRTSITGAKGGTSGVLLATAGDEVSVEVEPRDQFGNQTNWDADQKVSVEVSTSSSESVGPEMVELVHTMSQERDPASHGTHSVDRFTGRFTAAGSYVVWLRLNAQVVSGWPRIFQVVPTQVDPSRCDIYADPHMGVNGIIDASQARSATLSPGLLFSWGGEPEISLADPLHALMIRSNTQSTALATELRSENASLKQRLATYEAAAQVVMQAAGAAGAGTNRPPSQKAEYMISEESYYGQGPPMNFNPVSSGRSPAAGYAATPSHNVTLAEVADQLPVEQVDYDDGYETASSDGFDRL
eukprot:gene1872-2542_t